MTVVVSTRDVDTDQVIHHMSVTHGNYGTLCGVSTDDDLFEWIDSPPNQKVTCKDCTAIWQKAKEYRLSDIAKKLY